MRIALITTNDYYSKVALSSINNTETIDYFVKVNIKKKYKIKMFMKGLRKSFFYVIYLIYEMFKLKRLEKLTTKKRCLEEKIDYIIDDINTEDFIQRLKYEKIDIILFIRPTLIVKKNFLDAFPNSYNLHNTELPKYRGLGGIFQTLKHNEKTLGITIHRMTEKLDAGEITLQKKINIKESESLFELTLRSYKEARDILPVFIDLCKKNDLTFKVQDETNASTFSWPKIQDLKDFVKTNHRFF